MSGFKIVYHINENDRWPFTIRSAHNFIRDRETSSAVVVANGGAVRAFSRLDADPMRLAEIRDLQKEGVRFVVCEIALKSRHVLKEMIPEFVDIVPNGIVEIARLQNAEGYGYVRA